MVIVVTLEDKDKKEHKSYYVVFFFDWVDEVLLIALRYSKDAIGECYVQDQLLSTPPLTYHEDIVS